LYVLGTRERERERERFDFNTKRVKYSRERVREYGFMVSDIRESSGTALLVSVVGDDESNDF
jgi:hypothetical protein